jgi:antitoxin component of MazEF toxin-antitoxin module
MIALKLTQIGNSVGVVLPKEALVKLGGEGRRRLTDALLDAL